VLLMKTDRSSDFSAKEEARGKKRKRAKRWMVLKQSKNQLAAFKDKAALSQ